jgi:hypothetical protein
MLPPRRIVEGELMNHEEAKEILENQVRELKKRSYSEFRSWVMEKKIETPLVKGASGIEYQVEIEAKWDSQRRGDIGVLVSVDDGSLVSSFVPLGDSFIISSDESLVGQ